MAVEDKLLSNCRTQQGDLKLGIVCAGKRNQDACKECGVVALQWFRGYLRATPKSREDVN